MRLVALVVTAILVAGLAAAGQSAASSSGAASSPESAAKNGQKDTPSTGLPVSLDKIREGLEKTSSAPVIRGLNEQSAHFQVQIQERQKIEELLATLDFRTGPKGAPRYPGGWTQYEQDRLINHPIDSPLTQPFAAFSTSELLTIAIENLTAKYLGGRLVDAVSSAERARAERAAREEVAKSMADFCGSQPNQGSGLQVCAVNAPDR